MDDVAITLSAALAALLIVREAMGRRARAALREQLAAARDQEQLAHVGQLVSGLAQELKGPLQGVIGNTELMLASGSYGPASSDDLREIQENAARAAGIVRNLLAFTETLALNCRWQDINELAARAVDQVRGELEASGVHVRLALADRLPLWTGGSWKK
jgi:signal transduction histidine kinase